MSRLNPLVAPNDILITVDRQIPSNKHSSSVMCFVLAYHTLTSDWMTLLLTTLANAEWLVCAALLCLASPKRQTWLVVHTGEKKILLSTIKLFKVSLHFCGYLACTKLKSIKFYKHLPLSDFGKRMKNDFLKVIHKKF